MGGFSARPVPVRRALLDRHQMRVMTFLPEPPSGGLGHAVTIPGASSNVYRNERGYLLFFDGSAVICCALAIAASINVRFS
jgi:hypothetical protein